MSEWKEYRIKDIASMIGSGTTPSSKIERYYDPEEYHWINTGDFNDSEVFGGKQKISKAAISEIPTLRFYPKETVLVAMYGASIGKVGMLKIEATVNQACCAIIPHKKKVLPYFLFYAFIDFKDSLVSKSFGGTQPNVSQRIISNLVFKFPSLQEQQRIVDYLDEKLEAIDYRVEVLEKEKDAYARLKKSVINQAVTRGLNPNVSLKDSGIDWIGMIPEHWEIKRFKDVFRHYTTGLTPESKVEENFSDDERFTWVTIGDMTTRVVNESTMSLSEKVVIEKQPVISPKGSLLFSFKLSIGKTAFAGKDLFTNEAIVSIPPTKYADLNYFYYILPSVCFNNATENIYGAKMLNQKIIANMLMIYPPLPEQQKIVAYLDEKCAKIDAAIENISKQIDASKRLKKAVINEAISGKINFEDN